METFRGTTRETGEEGLGVNCEERAHVSLSEHFFDISEKGLGPKP